MPFKYTLQVDIEDFDAVKSDGYNLYLAKYCQERGQSPTDPQVIFHSISNDEIAKSNGTLTFRWQEAYQVGGDSPHTSPQDHDQVAPAVQYQEVDPGWTIIFSADPKDPSGNTGTSVVKKTGDTGVLDVTNNWTGDVKATVAAFVDTDNNKGSGTWKYQPFYVSQTIGLSSKTYLKPLLKFLVFFERDLTVGEYYDPSGNDLTNPTFAVEYTDGVSAAVRYKGGKWSDA